MPYGAVYVFIAAAILRLPRVVVRWEEWALHYSAYNLPTLEALMAGSYTAALTTWTGLHPPLYSILHSSVSLIWSAPIAWTALSAALSLGAVGLMLRAEPKTILPGFLLATDPVQLHYAAEVNNYPLGVFMLAYAWWAHRRNREGHLIVAVALGAWTHVLVGSIAAGLALWRPNRVRILSTAFIIVLPLLIGLVLVGTDPGSRKQPGLLLEASITDAIDRFGIGWIVCLPILLLGIPRAKAAATLWGAGIAMWFALVLIGFAAPHQFPYATFVGVPAALLIAAATQRVHGLTVIVALIAIIRGSWALAEDVGAIRHIWQDQQSERGIDHVWSISLPGDAIVLVRGPGAPDDDKRTYSPTLWRLRPWEQWTPIFTTERPDTVGQPRLLRGRRIYTFNHPIEAISQIPGEHVFTVLYRGAEQNPAAIPDHPAQGDWQTAGPDLWRGPTTADSGEDAARAAEATDGSQPDRPTVE